MIFLRQSTASQEFPLGYFVDSTDGNTEETGLTIANTDVKIWKAGATTLASKNSGGGTHISTGIYYCTLDATDTDTVGSASVFVHVSGALAFQKDICILPAAIYDWLFGTTANLPVNVTQFGGSAGAFSSGRPEVNTTHAAGTAWASGAITAASIATDAITAAKVAADAVAEIADGVWDEATSGHTSSGTAGLALRNADLRGERIVVRGTVGTGSTPSTTQFTPSALTPSGASLDQFKGRIIVFDNDTATAALRGQATNITASTNASLPLFTFSTLSTAPASGDTFSIC